MPRVTERKLIASVSAGAGATNTEITRHAANGLKGSEDLGTLSENGGKGEASSIES